jgi:hypothetical protein
MGIEPVRTVLQGLKYPAFREAWTAACDRRANFRAMRGNAGLRETTPFAIEFSALDREAAGAGCPESGDATMLYGGSGHQFEFLSAR